MVISELSLLDILGCDFMKSAHIRNKNSMISMPVTYRVGFFFGRNLHLSFGILRDFDNGIVILTIFKRLTVMEKLKSVHDIFLMIRTISCQGEMFFDPSLKKSL